MPIALGIDFEDITHTPAYRSLDDPEGIAVDIPAVTSDLLDLLAQHDVQATFFVVSELAERYPQLIREIDELGHEIASHTRSHLSLPDLDDEKQRQEIQGSKADLESVIDGSVVGFRAPTCRIDDRVYRQLVDARYTYSSSVMPSIPIPGFYSMDGGPRAPAQIEVAEKSICEFPLGVAPGIRLPIAGAWIRLLGRRYTLTALRRQAQSGTVCTYSHPWEFRSMPHPLPFRCRYRTGEWFRNTYERILKLDCEFVTCSTLCNRLDTDLGS